MDGESIGQLCGGIGGVAVQKCSVLSFDPEIPVILIYTLPVAQLREVRMVTFILLS